MAMGIPSGPQRRCRCLEVGRALRNAHNAAAPCANAIRRRVRSGGVPPTRIAEAPGRCREWQRRTPGTPETPGTPGVCLATQESGWNESYHDLGSRWSRPPSGVPHVLHVPGVLGVPGVPGVLNNAPPKHTTHAGRRLRVTQPPSLTQPAACGWHASNTSGTGDS